MAATGSKSSLEVCSAAVGHLREVGFVLIALRRGRERYHRAPLGPGDGQQTCCEGCQDIEERVALHLLKTVGQAEDFSLWEAVSKCTRLALLPDVINH